MSPRFSSLLRRGALAVAVAVAASSSAAAQATGTIRGRVVETASQRPIPEAQVFVDGTNIGALTNSNGEYTITAVPAGQHTVTARRIGYSRAVRNLMVSTAAPVTADFTLSQAASQLDRVVVTGTAGSQEKRTVGNAVAQLDVADITSKTTSMTVTDILQGRTPGVTVAAGAGTPGTSSEITIRGYGSFTNNRPVVFVDGVRMDTEDIGSFNPSGSGTGGFSGQRTSALDLINPQDIESIEVLKGPAAATLYGADAASGVIQVITKKGRRGQQSLKWTGRYETGRNSWGVDQLTNYSTCTAARKTAVDAAGVPLWSGCQGRADNEVITDQPFVRDPLALRNGAVNNMSMSLRGGGDRYSFYISGDGIKNEGYNLNNDDSRRSLRTNFTFNPDEKTDFAINVGYIRQDLSLPLGDEAANGLLLSGARGIPGRTRPREALLGWATIEPSLANLYNNDTRSDRFTFGTTVNYAPFSWWRNRLTAGLDQRFSTAQILSLPGDPDVPAGLNAMRSPKAYNYTLDYSGSFLKALTSDLGSTTSIGSQVTSRRDESVTATGTQLPTREITIIGAALSVSGSNSFSEFNSVGFYAQEQISWKNRLFLTGAVRADDHSSFGTNFDAIFYPKAAVSYVISDEPALKGYFDAIRASELRLRGAWGRAGRAPEPFSATQTYGSTRVALSPTTVGGALVTRTYGNPDLKPELGEEIELGFDAEFVGGRAGTEFTYYRKSMRDLLVPVALPPSLGFAGSVLQNLGQTLNQGVEMGLTGTPWDRRNVTWETRLNLTWNKNRLVALDTFRTEEIPGGASYTPGLQRNRVGYPLGSYFARYPTRDANGNYVLNRNAAGVITTPVYDTAFTFVGPAIPTRSWSFSNTLTLFKNFRLYGLLDFQGGHYLINYKEYNRCALAADGPNCALLNQPGLQGTAQLDTLRAVYGITGTPLTVTLPMTQTQYLEKADYVKLRDLSLTWMMPSSLSQRLRMESANIVLSGKNLGLWTDYSGLDPEVNGYSNNQLRGSGNAAQFVRVDAYSWPMARRYTVQLNVTY
jgi:TonB-dependent starch-binding outer membrane protein SusC